MKVIIQAGGRGSRLGYHTDNKPKTMVSVDNLPMIFHMFQKFPQNQFLIIADYKSDVLEKYLKAFAKVDYKIINSTGLTGTCSGISGALKYVPDGESFLLIWSDLVLSKGLAFPFGNENYIGLSKKFECRWRFNEGKLENTPSSTSGVAGCFVFKEKAELSGIPQSGEFVRWLSEKNIAFTPFDLQDTREYGLIDGLPLPVEGKCRPFNRTSIRNGHLIKEPVDDQGRVLAEREKKWYAYVKERGYTKIPQIYSFEPLEMELIKGKNIYSYKFDESKKEAILRKMVDNLRSLHNIEDEKPDKASIVNAYYGKTMERLEQVRSMIPYADQESIRINGRNCRNIFFHQDKVKKMIDDLECPAFCLIHGDCTFSNMMLKNDEDPVLIDPRGYFGNTEMHGDPAYDWAKMYYSLAGNYDQFNLRRFKLKIAENIELNIDSNGWEDMEDIFFQLLSDETDRKAIKLIHAMIWLSLTTYAWDDYDSICGAFYNGLYYLEEVL